jgi:hypothetical protein
MEEVTATVLIPEMDPLILAQERILLSLEEEKVKIEIQTVQLKEELTILGKIGPTLLPTTQLRIELIHHHQILVDPQVDQVAVDHLVGQVVEDLLVEEDEDKMISFKLA